MIMKKFNIFSFVCLLLATGLFSCKKDFSEINDDPNRSAIANPETLIAPTIYRIVNVNQNRALRLNNELMQVHVTVINSDEIHRYVIRPSESEYMWSNWYLQRTNVLDIYRGGEMLKQKSYMGIANILDAWVTSMITDMFGNVPYVEANQGRYTNNLQPRFDSQEEIYKDLFRKLEEANTLLAANQELTVDDKALDPLFNGDLSKWRKFGNAMYLRLLMRVSGKPEMKAAEKIKEIAETKKADYPVFTSNNESAILRFTTVPPYTSAFNTYREYDFNGDNGLCSFFLNNLKAWGDPRIDRWATKVDGAYDGIPSGYAVGNAPERLSAYQKTLMNEPLLGNILNYAELQFILAEAALKGYIGGDPKDYYNAGVQSAVSMWSDTAGIPAGYLEREGIKWDATESMETKMEKIHLQKYYTLFFTDFQQWHEYRRTGHPILPKGPGLQNNGRMPARFKYPVFLQSLNQSNYQKAVSAMGGDDLNVKVWWNK